LYAGLDDRLLIGVRDLIAAKALVDYSIDTARYVLSEPARNTDVERLRDAVDAGGRMKLTDVYELFGRNYKRETIADTIETLCKDGEYRVYVGPRGAKGGRPPTYVERVPDEELPGPRDDGEHG
jgi:hypothetical protein